MDAYKIISFPGDNLPEEFRPVVLSRWLNSLRKGNDYFKLIDSVSYYRNYHFYIESVLRNPATIVSFAVLEDNIDVILGWSVVRGSTLDYVHVHKDYRTIGIAKALVPKEILLITHLTKTGMSIWSAKIPAAKFNPFA